jgi:hypothetical protein
VAWDLGGRFPITRPQRRDPWDRGDRGRPAEVLAWVRSRDAAARMTQEQRTQIVVPLPDDDDLIDI